MASDARARDGFAGVLALKAIPALSQAHPDDLIALALRCSERRFPAGARLAPTADEPSSFFLVEGRVLEQRVSGEPAALEAPALAGTLAVLAGEEPELIAASEGVALEIGRAALLEVLEDEFELWVALLRHVCRTALEAAAQPSGWEPRSRERMLLSEPPDLAERLLLLRRIVPFAGLPVALLGQLACELETVTAARGSVLWEAGDPATHMLAIGSGGVTVEPRAPARARRHGPGALVGLAETLGAEAYGFRLRAAGPLRALRLDGEALVDALEDDPASAVELLRALARHLRGTTP